MKRFGLLFILLCSTTLQAYDLLFLEDWDSTPSVPTNTRGWFLGGYTEYSPIGGNSGGYARGLPNTAFPFLLQLPNVQKDYAGNVNYQELGVSRLCIDAKVDSIEFSDRLACPGMTLFLINDNNTPDDLSDGWSVITVGQFFGVEGAGWEKVCFDIPSQATTLPSLWDIRDEGGAYDGELPPNASWQNVITDVDRLAFLFAPLLGDGCGSFDQQWDLGIDNIAVYTGGPNIVPVPALGRSAWILLFTLIMGVGLVVLFRQE